MNLESFTVAAASLRKKNRIARLNGSSNQASNDSNSLGTAGNHIEQLLDRCQAIVVLRGKGKSEQIHPTETADTLCFALLNGGHIDVSSSSSHHSWELYALGVLLLKELLEEHEQKGSSSSSRDNKSSSNDHAALIGLALNSVPGLLAHPESRLRKLSAVLVYQLACHAATATAGYSTTTNSNTGNNDIVYVNTSQLFHSIGALLLASIDHDFQRDVTSRPTNLGTEVSHLNSPGLSLYLVISES